MKKFVFLMVFAVLITAFAFADNFTVQSVSGRVERESGSQRVAVNAGDVLTSQNVIHVAIGASVVLVDGAGRAVTIPSTRNGAVADLVRASSGIRLGAGGAQVDLAGAARATGQVGTGSARASDEAADDDIVE